ncbi:MAG: hypothetical protein H6704_23540 [Myxococcales bacterium]|nr:hypothetical protein [Myxococcales bacterium]
MRRISLSERAKYAWTTCLLTTLIAACAAPLDDPDLPDLRAPALGRLDAAKADGAVLGALACGQSIEVELAPEPSFWKLDVPAGAALRLKVEARLSGRALKGGLFGEAGGAPLAATAPCGPGAWCLEGKAPPPTAFVGLVAAEPTVARVTLDCDGEGGEAEERERPPLEPLPPAPPVDDEALCVECDWRAVCVDVIVVGKRDAAGDLRLGQLLETTPEGFNRVAPISAPAGRLTGALTPLGGLAGAPGVALLQARVDRLFTWINDVYAPCCVWFRPGGAWALDADRAGRALAGRVTADANGDPVLAGGDDVLRDLEAFADRDPATAGGDCLRLVIAPSYAPPRGTERGRAIVGGRQMVVGYDTFDFSLYGFYGAHEVGHAMGLGGHWTGGVSGPTRENVMRARPTLHRRPEIDVAAQCGPVRDRAADIGLHLEPPVCEDPSGGGEDEDDEAADPVEVDPLPRRCFQTLHLECTNGCAGGYCCADANPPPGAPPCGAVCDRDSPWCRG